MQTQLRLCGCTLHSACAGRHPRLSLSRLHYKPATVQGTGGSLARLAKPGDFWAVLGVTGDTLACQPENCALQSIPQNPSFCFVFFKAFHIPALLHQHNPCFKACSRKSPAQLLFPRCHREGEQKTHLAPAELQHWAAPIYLDTDMYTHTPAKYKINPVFKELQCQC